MKSKQSTTTTVQKISIKKIGASFFANCDGEDLGEVRLEEFFRYLGRELDFSEGETRTFEITISEAE